MSLKPYFTMFLLLGAMYTLGCFAAEHYKEESAWPRTITLFNQCARSSFILSAQTSKGSSPIPLTALDHKATNFILFAGGEITIPVTSIVGLQATAIIIQPRCRRDTKNPLRSKPAFIPISDLITGNALRIYDTHPLKIAPWKAEVISHDDPRLPHTEIGSGQKPAIPSNPYDLFAGARQALTAGKTVAAHHILSIDPASSVGIDPGAINSRTVSLISKLRGLEANPETSQAQQLILEQGIELVRKAAHYFRLAEVPISKEEVAQYKKLSKNRRHFFGSPGEYQDKKYKEMEARLAPIQLAIVQKITELVRALENKDLSQVKQIISSNIDEFAYWHDFSGNTIFHYAAKIGWSEGMSFLLTISKFESLINTRNNCDNTPLHIAMNLALTHNNFDIVNLLIEHGARTDIVGYLQGHYLTTNQMFLRSQAEAFARSQHLHLGEDSLAAGISCDVIKIIMGYLCQQP